MLVYKDFGTATAAPDIPFFGLYNKYRGILRLMFFNTQQLTYSRFNIELSFMSTSATGAYLTFSDEVRAFRNDYDKARVENFMVEANSYNGWIYADYTIAGYDPSLSTSARFRVHIRGMNTSNVTLESTQFTLSEVLRDANPGPALNGSDLLGAANKGKKFFSDVSKASKSLREEAEKSGNTNKWWSSAVKSLLGTISKPTTIASLAPVVGGLVGLITSFIGGMDDPAPRQPLNFTGSLKMDGTIT